MKLALVLGTSQGQAVKPRLEGVKDNLDIDIYDNIPKFIDLAFKKNTKYDRILILSTMLKTNTILEDLYNYWSSTSKETQIVVLCRKGKDEGVANTFLQVFKTTVAAVMFVDKTTVQVLSEAAILPPIKITEKYGIKDYLNVETEEAIYEEPEPEVKEVKPEPQKKKGGFLSGLFGGKKAEPQKPVQNTQQQNDVNQENNQNDYQEDYQNDEYQNDNYDDDYQEEYQDDGYQDDNYQDEDYQENYQEDDYQEEYQDDGYQDDNNQENYQDTTSDDVQQEQVQEDDFDYTDDDTSFSNEPVENDFSENIHDEAQVLTADLNPFINKQVTTPEDKKESVQEFVENNISQPNLDGNTESSVVEDIPIQPKKEKIPKQHTSSVEVEEVDEDFSSFSMGSSNAFTEDTSELDNDFIPETVDEDFGAQTFRDTQSRKQQQRPTEVADVDEDLGDLSVASAEEAYRQANEQPKVIVKEVVREVEKPVLGSSGNTLRGVLGGRLHKTIIVTGDRGTGVTTTALMLAKEFAKKVKVLYFDCDVVNHGLLSYIDYSTFRDYENIHMQGVKLCRKNSAFPNCVVSYDTNLDILTTDYSCDTTDEELEIAQGVVAENVEKYGVVIVDCPVSKLHCIQDLVLIGNGIICVEESKRGFMNMLCQFEGSPLAMRYKRTLANKGTMFVTKNNKNTDLKKLIKYISDLFASDGADWLNMPTIQFNGKLNDKIINEVLES